MLIKGQKGIIFSLGAIILACTDNGYIRAYSDTRRNMQDISFMTIAYYAEPERAAAVLEEIWQAAEAGKKFFRLPAK